MANINKQHFLLAGSCAVVLSVFSRSSVGGRRQGIREVNETTILINSIFSVWEFLGCSLLLLWFLLGILPERDRKGTREGNLKNRTITKKAHCCAFFSYEV